MPLRFKLWQTSPHFVIRARLLICKILPFRNTHLDEALLAAIRQADVPYGHRKLVIITQFRGSRKTWTAQRCAMWRTLNPFQQIKYIDARKLGGDQVLLHYSPVLFSCIDLVAGFLLVATFVFVWLVVTYIEKGEWPSGQSFSRLVQDKLPSGFGIAAVVIMALACRRWRQVLIVDDPVGAQGINSAVQRMQASNFLELIRKNACDVPTILISSNEGIAQCFMDTAPLLHRTAPFPNPSVEDILKLCTEEGLRDCHGQPITEDHVLKSEKYLPEHICYSVRFWGKYANHFNKDSAALDRQVLWKICLGLELMAHNAFMAEALVLSPQLNNTQREIVANLTGCDLRRLPESLPRRLGLAWALTLSTEGGARAQDELAFEQEEQVLEAQNQALEAQKQKLEVLIRTIDSEEDKGFLAAKYESVTESLKRIQEEQSQCMIKQFKELHQRGTDQATLEANTFASDHKFLKELKNKLAVTQNPELASKFTEEIQGLFLILERATGTGSTKSGKDERKISR